MKKLADKISFGLLATRKHPDYDWLKDTLEKEVKPKSFLDNKWVKILFSISIIYRINNNFKCPKLGANWFGY